MGEMVWWAANLAVAAAVLPLIAREALRIIRSLQVVEAAVADIRASARAVAAGLPAAGRALSETAALCEDLEASVRVTA
jgi:hypothetical protein